VTADGDLPGEPSPGELVRTLPRALRRAEDGRALTRTEAAALFTARGEQLDRLVAVAARVRDAAPWYREGAWGRASDGRPRVTYSRKVFIPLTHLCRDACGYCTFAHPPRAASPAFLAPEQVLDIARAGAAAGCREALFTLGDRPEERYPSAREWLDARGYASTLEYLRAVAILVIEGTGLLPHLNPGLLSWSELASLKQVAPSMGIMLEQVSDRLHAPGGAHQHAATKRAEVRLRTLEDAGRLSVPFTSGMLIGIGETPGERVDTLLALRATHRRHGHLQEVIVQNFRAKPDTAMRAAPEPDADEMVAAVATARILLGPTVHLQAPPNLSPHDLPRVLAAGIDDWGGVSPVTPDHVNPEAPWPAIERLEAVSEAGGFVLTERLTAYPEYVTTPDPWLAGRMRAPVAALARTDGLADTSARAVGRPWQDPVVVPHGMTTAMRAVVEGDGSGASAADGRNARAADRDDAVHRAVFGDVHAIAEGVVAANAPRPRRRPPRHASGARSPPHWTARLGHRARRRRGAAAVRHDGRRARGAGAPPTRCARSASVRS
jgi:FO synthase